MVTISVAGSSDKNGVRFVGGSIEAVDLVERLFRRHQLPSQHRNRSACFAGWGPYERFARVYSVDTLHKRVLHKIPADCMVEIVEINIDGQPVPDLTKHRHQPKVNGHMKALVITRR